jgi:hypothetical protein
LKILRGDEQEMRREEKTTEDKKSREAEKQCGELKWDEMT